MKRLPFIFYFFFFQAVVLAAMGTLEGDVAMMCSGWVGSVVCTAIVLRSRQQEKDGTVQHHGLRVPTNSAHHASAAASWAGGAANHLDRYQSVMARLRLTPTTGQTSASLVMQHKHWFNGGEQAAHAFFHHPQVVKALNLDGSQNATSRSTETPTGPANPDAMKAGLVNDTFWGNLEQKAAASVPAADGACGMANCSNEVNAFSFQCFQCRRRVCDSCGNTGVLCRTCAS